MRSDLARVFAGGAALALATAPLAPAAAHYLDVSSCANPGKAVQIPVPGKEPRDPQCPTGCHAVIGRRCLLQDAAD